MIQKSDLPLILEMILLRLGGKANILTVFKEFYKLFGSNLTEDNPLFYTWNYDIRWAATKLRKEGIMAPAKVNEKSDKHCSLKGIWELSDSGKRIK